MGGENGYGTLQEINTVDSLRIATRFVEAKRGNRPPRNRYGQGSTGRSPFSTKPQRLRNAPWNHNGHKSTDCGPIGYVGTKLAGPAVTQYGRDSTDCGPTGGG